MDKTLIDALFVESFGFESNPGGKLGYARSTDGGWVFVVNDGETIGCNLAIEAMTRSQFVMFVQSLGVANPWIPVTQQQPADMDSVLIAIPEDRGYPDDNGRVGLGCFTHDSKQWHEACIDIRSGNETFEDCEVKPTHWMPLPDLGDLFKGKKLRKPRARKPIDTPIRTLN